MIQLITSRATPEQNRSMTLQNSVLREKIERIVDELLRGVVP